MDPFIPKIDLKNDQAAAFAQLQHFLNSKESVFLLRGYAGTGKTTLLNVFCQYLSHERQTFRLMAPTGRAAMVLERKTGQKASTIHRLIYNIEKLQERKEGNSFKYFFGLKANEESNRTIYLVDEASMLSDQYQEDEFMVFGSGHPLQDLLTYVFDNNEDNKLIFIGDDAQLPPVSMAFSPALSNSYLLEQMKSKPPLRDASLTEVVRQKADSGVLSSATRLRHALENKQFQSFELDRGKGDVLPLAQHEWLPTYQQQVRDASEGIIITYANRQALVYNLDIRERRFGNSHIPLQVGEWLLLVRNNYNYSVELFNGMLVEVLDVGAIERSDTIVFKGKKELRHQRKLVFRSARIAVEHNHGERVELKVMLLDNTLWEPSGKLNPLDQQALYVDYKNRMSKKNIKPGTSDFREGMRVDPWFNALHVKFGYAMTCHKAQGGEWAKVFVDFAANFSLLSSAYFRWAYTAVTRAGGQLYCLNLQESTPLNQFVLQDIEHLPRAVPAMYYQPTDPADKQYFVKYRQQRLLALAADNELQLNITEHAYQLDLHFGRATETVHYKIWYSNQGFTSSQFISGHNSSIAAEVEAVLQASLLPDKIPFSPRSPAQQQLYEHLLSLLEEHELSLTNIVQREWSDVYFFKTQADCAGIEFFFNRNYVFTKAIPKSTQGKEDKELQAIIADLQGVA